MIKSVRLINFFSFGDCTIDLEPDLNVLVGINGSGKSNFLRAFQLLKAGMDGKLREQIVRWGGHSSIINKRGGKDNGMPDVKILINLDYKYLLKLGYQLNQDITYEIRLMHMVNYDAVSIIERLKLNDSTLIFSTPAEGVEYYNTVSKERKILDNYEDDIVGELVLPKFLSQSDMPELKAIARALRDIDIYKLFNTVEDSPIRNSVRATGLDKLMANGDNMFQVLNVTGLKSTVAYDAIESGLHNVNEYFQRFRMNVYGQGSVEFYLQEKGLETPIHASQVSDGTLCYLCLLVALYQPDRGNIILFDEPERNLHPDMLFELAKQLEKASEKSQIILTTHAPGLLNQFPLRAVRVFEKDENNQTIVKKFTEEDFAGWYDEFAPGQMWRNGDLGGNRY